MTEHYCIVLPYLVQREYNVSVMLDKPIRIPGVYMILYTTVHLIYL